MMLLMYMYIASVHSHAYTALSPPPYMQVSEYNVSYNFVHFLKNQHWSHLHWLVPFGKYVEQICRGYEVEAREGQSLGFKVVRECLFTHGKSVWT